MAKLRPVSRNELIRKLRALGFNGPVQRGKHPYMYRDPTRLTIPNPHRETISVDLLSRMLRQAGITRNQWLNG